jgi:predicted ATPase
MWIKSVSAKNFRGLRDIHLDFNRQVNVIVGPNAVGKSTILEAIRLAKAVCAPRTPQETLQVLMSLRAATPHQPQRIIPDGIAQDASLPIEISCVFEFSDGEVAILDAAGPRIATHLVQSRTNFGNNPAAFTAFITSPVGKEALRVAEQEFYAGIDTVKKDRACHLGIKIDFAKDRMEGTNPIQAIFFQFLEQRLPANLALFSYFPADRALPPGEQPIQIGLQDASQQLESHNSQPHTKYARVKNSIFNSVIMNDEERQAQLSEFQRIFDGLLRNRKIVGPSVNQHGQLSINVMDTDTNRVFDIDSMSSGEKGLVLTWLLIARSITQDGMVLLDEPELHLNPAVCKHILPFIIDNYVGPKGLQAIICSHSPAILAGAFSRTECSLFHLRTQDLGPVIN